MADTNRQVSSTIDWIPEALDVLASGESFVIATIVAPSGHPTLGRRILIRGADAECGLGAAFCVSHPGMWHEVVESVRARRGAQLVSFNLTTQDGSPEIVPTRVFFTHCAPPAEAWIFGAGHIALALAPVLDALDWRVIVCDDRAEFVTNERFPTAQELRMETFEKSALACAERSEAWVILVTRGHQHDEQILRVLSQEMKHSSARRPRYVGMIGSKRRVKTVHQRLETEEVSAEFLESLHAPIGLPLGAETPTEIAISIASEMVAVRRGHRHNPATGTLEPLEGFGPAMADTGGSGDLWRRVYDVCAVGKPAVLATVIDRRGSAPRGIGAQMAIFADGSTAGTIGGGCGEAEVLHAARGLIVGAKWPFTLDVDLTGDDAAEAGDVCGGRYTVFLETLVPH